MGDFSYDVLEMAPPDQAGIVDIVIVNWNAGEQLRDCLHSIEQHGDNLVKSVVVVDNGSSDGSAELKDVGLPLVLIKAGENLGFGRACNLGASRATAPFILFLNPDAMLMPGSLEVATGFLGGQSGRDVGVVGIQLIDEQGHVQRHTTNRAAPRTMFTHEQRAVRFDHLSSRPVDHVIGAFYLIRSDVFRALGGFDERFFVYLEDVDLSVRVQDAGWAIHYLAEARAFHKGGGTSDQVKARRLFYSMRSRIVYSFKHFPVVHAATVAAVTLFAEPVLRLGRALGRHSRAEALETLAAFGYLYRDLPAIVRAVRRVGSR